MLKNFAVTVLDSSDPERLRLIFRPFLLRIVMSPLGLVMGDTTGGEVMNERLSKDPKRFFWLPDGGMGCVVGIMNVCCCWCCTTG